MHRGRNRNDEKPNNFKEAITHLFKELTNKRLIMMAIVLAIFSAIISIKAPDKLSLLTDEISKGLVPNIDESLIVNIMNNPDISIDDKIIFSNMMSEAKDISKEELIAKFDSLPQSIYDIVKPKMDLARIKTIGITLIIMYILSAIFSYVGSITMTIVANKFAKTMRSKISKKINMLPLKYFDKHKSGDVLSVVTNDVDMIAQSMNQSLASLASSITLFIGTIFMMFTTNWQMALTAIISSVIGFIGMSLILSKSQKYFSERQIQLGQLSGHIEEIYTNINVVKLYNGEKLADSKFDELNEAVAKSNRLSQFYSGIMQPLMGFIGNLGYVAVCIVGALLVANDIISFGVIIAFIVYVRLFTNPLSQIAQAMTQLQSTAAASERVFKMLDEDNLSDQSNIKNKLNIKNVKGDIEFKNVTFTYDDNDKPTIKNFSAKVLHGQNVAIVGPTGAGKTTMVNLLMKFYDIDSGEILIDGTSISELTRENIHDLFNMVLQDTWMFEGTIRENIVYNQKNITDEMLDSVCHEVGLTHFINTLPSKYDTIFKEDNGVSEGQRQLLTIARAMVKNAPFLILDEATSNVDTRTEKIVQMAMDKLTEGRTSFIIAHRLSTIKNADLILVMKDGNIIEQGNHLELMKKNGFYAELYNSQFNNN